MKVIWIIGLLLVQSISFAAILFLKLKTKRADYFSMIRLKQQVISFGAAFLIFCVFPVGIGAGLWWAAFFFFRLFLFKKDGARLQTLYDTYQQKEEDYPIVTHIKELKSIFFAPTSKVAECLGVSRQAVSKWENGSADPSTSNLLALAKLFGVSPEKLLQSITSKS